MTDEPEEPLDDEEGEGSSESTAPTFFDGALDPARKQPNPLHEIQDWARYTHRTLLRMIAKLVPWSEFWEYGNGKQLAYNRFEALLGVAMADLFTEYDDRRKASYLQVTLKWLTELRKHPQFPGVRDRVASEMRKVRDAKTIDDWARILEVPAAQETAAVGLFAKSLKDKQAGLDALLDRRSAKKGRGGEAPEIHLHLPEGFMESRQRTLQIEAEILRSRRLALPPGDSEVVDASFVRVPEDA